MIIFPVVGLFGYLGMSVIYIQLDFPLKIHFNPSMCYWTLRTGKWHHTTTITYRKWENWADRLGCGCCDHYDMVSILLFEMIAPNLDERILQRHSLYRRSVASLVLLNQPDFKKTFSHDDLDNHKGTIPCQNSFFGSSTESGFIHNYINKIIY